VRCPSCHKNFYGSYWNCPDCWSPLVPGTYSDPVNEETPAFRPAGTPAFERLGALVLRRLSPGGTPVYFLPDGRPRLTCVDLDGSELDLFFR
jgi:hypothetical protein